MGRNIHIRLLAWAIVFLMVACVPTPKDVKKLDVYPDIYPDYIDVTIPVNIAPLNFIVCDADAIVMKAGNMTFSTKGDEMTFGDRAWRELVEHHKDIRVTLTVLKNGKWTEYKPFYWHVVSDKIDSWLTYRLIEPDYTVGNELEIKQRCVESFKEDVLCDHHLAENRCMNCHATANNDPSLSMFYLRGTDGGAILNQNGRLRKLNIKTDSIIPGSTYYGFSPSGRYIVFSNNVVMPAYYFNDDKRMEVYDSASDIFVADVQGNRIIQSSLLSDSNALETFPTFSPDGKYIYYCTAKRVDLPNEYKQLKYALVRIPFNEQTGEIGNVVDTLYKGKSVCHPRLSPDGRYILFTVQDYGTFPIWHRESDLWMMDLQTHVIDTLAVVNSPMSDTYHSWSSNSRWFVFASRRDDGLYTKPYFCYIDKNGRTHKPFCLPQRRPHYYENTLKSFNIPELSKGKIPFNAVDVAVALKLPAEPFE